MNRHNWLKRWLTIIFVTATFTGIAQNRGAIALSMAKFITGDNPAWSNPSTDDSQWKEIQTGKVWQAQGYPDYHGYAWYRMHVQIPLSLKDSASWKDSLRIFLAHVNDVDDTYLNGVKIGHIGSFPDEAGGYVSKWPATREYHLSVKHPAIRWDADNVIAIRVYDGGGTGGIFMGQPYIDMLALIDGIAVNMSNQDLQYLSAGINAPVSIENKFNTTVAASFAYSVYDAAQKKYLLQKKVPVQLKPFERYKINIAMPDREGVQFSYVFTEEKSSLTLKQDIVIPYLLTPPPPGKPAINSTPVTAVRPGSPFLYKIPVTGKQPISYSVQHLPEGLQLDKEKGIISGTVVSPGNYRVTLIAGNSIGKSQKDMTIKAGDKLALTPPLGWNSWNCWGISVSDEKVRSSAQSLIDKGLINHGWTYINIDDGWEASQRATDGSIVANEKFPDMKKLGDWLHGNGLRFGIYSSPGPKTCGGYLGTYQHELKDAETYASWGVDYLKYDWCSYSDIIKDEDTATAHFIEPYKIMQQALAAQNRDIYYSLCQYGMKNVEQWGPSVNAQSWRTTGDIEDTWQSLKYIGFSQAPLYKYAMPGRWNDPDMLIVGMVGWGENLHPTRLTPYEQYTHISLWCLLSAPLLIGCDISKMDTFTLNLLTNDEVIAINQDLLGRQARQLVKNDSCQVWVKDMEDGSKAIGLFNMSDKYKQLSINWTDIGVGNTPQVRDVWRQQNMGIIKNKYSAAVPPHGVKLLRVKKD